MTLTPEQVERTLQEHRATTDERFGRLISELQSDREHRQRAPERIIRTNGALGVQQR